MERVNYSEVDSKKNESISEKSKLHKNASKTVSRTSSITSDKSVRLSKSSSTSKQITSEVTLNDSVSKASTNSSISGQVVEDTKKWSTLEKKWSSSMDKTGNKTSVIQSGDAKNKIAQFGMNSERTSTTDSTKIMERPRDLSFSSAFTGHAKSKMSPGSSGSVTPCVKNIREMADRWEGRSNSFDTNATNTPTNCSQATTPTPALSFSRRSTQDTFFTPTSNTILQHGMASSNSQVR
jgi:hypothetical protein